MKKTAQNRFADKTVKGSNRRVFLKKSILIGTAGTVAGMGLLSGCRKRSGGQTDPTEDLMREHATLRRIMFIYDHCRQLLIDGQAFDPALLAGAADIIRTFVEDYHERMEEEVLFPAFTRRNQMVQLVQALSIQHKTGRELTDEILRYVDAGSMNDAVLREKLIQHLHAFNIMYRPHAAVEDDALFAVLRNLLPQSDYLSLAEELETSGLELLGENDLETLTGRIAVMEKELGIDDLSQYI